MLIAKFPINRVEVFLTFKSNVYVGVKMIKTANRNEKWISGYSPVFSVTHLHIGEAKTEKNEESLGEFASYLVTSLLTLSLLFVYIEWL